MRRLLLVVLAGLTGLVAGGVSMVALQAPAVEPERPGDGTPDEQVDPWPGDTWPSGNDASKVGPPASSDHRLLLVWTAGGLPDGLEDGIAGLAGVQQVTTVAGDVVDLVGSRGSDGAVVDDLDAGWAIPLDALAIDPGEYALFLPKADHASIAGLPEGDVLLGSTSADLRGLKPGDTMTFAGGHERRIHAVVDDALIGAAEVVFARADGAAVGVDKARFLLLTHSGERASLEQAIRRLTDVDVRVRGPGETPYLRHGDAVLTQVHVKAEFGEFAYRPAGTGVAIDQDPTWPAEHVGAVEVPILGTVRCHRGIAKQLAGALTEVTERGLDHLVDPDQFEGCHAPRLIAPGAGVSRHAWGIAVDLNAEDNPYGQAPVQDPRLVEIFARWGFTWGGFWLVPDAMHFEYVGHPEIGAAKGDAVD